MADEMNKEREAFEAWYCDQMRAAGYNADEGIAQLREGNHYGKERVMLNGKSEPVAWGIFDSQGFYEAAHDQGSAERFCAHYNKRKGADPLKPYTAIPLYTHPSPPEGAPAGATEPDKADPRKLQLQGLIFALARLSCVPPMAPALEHQLDRLTEFYFDSGDEKFARSLVQLKRSARSEGRRSVLLPSASVNADGSITQGTWAHLKLMMEASAWDGQLQLSDALANIDDFAAARPSPPEGMAVTDAMIDAGKKMLHNRNGRGAREKVERIFNAMIAAAPPASEAKGA
jgi:hypothetical protein